MPGSRSAPVTAGRLNAMGEPLLPRGPNMRLKRRHFLARALASAAILALSGCDAPTFDRDTGILVFRRSYSGGSERNHEQHGMQRKAQ